MLLGCTDALKHIHKPSPPPSPPDSPPLFDPNNADNIAMVLWPPAPPPSPNAPPPPPPPPKPPQYRCDARAELQPALCNSADAPQALSGNLLPTDFKYSRWNCEATHIDVGDLVPVSVALQNNAQMTSDGPSKRYVSAALRARSVIEMIYACTEASCSERHGVYNDVFVWHHMLGGPGIVTAVDIGIQPTYMSKGNLHHQGMARINIHNQIDFGPKERRLICIVYLRALRAPNAPSYVFHLRLESDRDAFIDRKSVV